VALKKSARAVKVVGFDHENSAVVCDETGTVVEVDVVGREQHRDRLQLRWLHELHQLLWFPKFPARVFRLLPGTEKGFRDAHYT
jgi:hypothetical protein